MESMERSLKQSLAVHILNSQYLGTGYIIDVPKDLLEQWASEGPVYILCARYGQVVRINKTLVDKNNPIKVEGWWTLTNRMEGKPLSSIAALFSDYRHIIFMDPERVDPSFKSKYSKLIKLAERVAAGTWKFS